MELTVSLNLGRLNAELTGEDRQELQNELVEFINFLEENEGIIDDVLSRESERVERTDSADEAIQYVEEQPHQPTSDFGDIPDRTSLEPGTLSSYFDLDPDGDEPPFLNFNTDVLGESGSARNEKQMRASLILLTLWRECLGLEPVVSSDLKDALRISGIDDTELSNMYQFNNNEGNRYFRREGRGQNTEIELTLPGQREGYDQIRRTVERLESDDDE